jgi:hypothetical protein
MTSNKPAWAGEYGPSYEDIVRSWPYEVLDFETFGSYQGDHLALLKNGDAIGLVVFGYGSCSGCDKLEAITPWDDDEDSDWQPLIDFAATLRDAIHWEGDRDQLREWIDARPENNWWSYDNEISKWLNANLSTSLKVEEY